MPRKVHTESQIVAILREAEGELTIEEVCRKHAISRNTFYRWKKIYCDLDASQARELKHLRTENAKMKRKLAELLMENEDLRFLNRRKW